MVEEVHATHSVGKQVQNSHCDETSVEAIAVVITSKSLAGRFCSSLEWRGAEEALEAGAGDF
jgi:hypothetical protein